MENNQSENFAPERITAIKEIDDGFIVGTTEQIISLRIDMDTQCCERTGFFWSNDNPEDFIGARLINVKVTDSCLNTDKAPEIYEGNVMFVTLETDRGDLQFVAYNEHNGYYSHDATVECKQLNITERL